MKVTAHDSNFPPPNGDKDADEILAGLRYADGVAIPEGDTADLLRAGEHAAVARALWAQANRASGAENNLGCAYAHLHEWDHAVAALERAGDEDLPRHNLGVVKEAKTP